MNKISKLFQLIELTRSMPQYGYALSGIKQDDLSNLAEHHYLVSFIAWQLALVAKRAGGQVNVGKVIEFAMIHDLGELFGGDISMPYAMRNPKAREYAKAFEAENQKFLAKYFGEGEEYFQSLADEIMDASSDESLIAKLADYMECTEYKRYMNKLIPEDIRIAEERLPEKVEEIKDEKSRQAISDFIQQWIKGLGEDSGDHILKN